MNRSTSAYRITRNLQNRGITQAAVAQILGLDPAAISRRFHGAIDFNLSEIDALAAALEVPAAELLTTPDTKEPQP